MAVRAVIRHVHRMNHRARAQKEQRLEERVRHQMEDARAVRSDPDTDEHVAKLRHGGVGENLLDVVLFERDGRRKQRGEHPHSSNRGTGNRREREQHRRTRHEVHAGRNHGSCVDERGDRRGSCHRVRQPHIERHLRALAGGAQEEEEGDGRDERTAVGERSFCSRKDRYEVQGAERREQVEHGDKEAQVANAIDDEGLLARAGLLDHDETRFFVM